MWFNLNCLENPLERGLPTVFGDAAAPEAAGQRAGATGPCPHRGMLLRVQQGGDVDGQIKPLI